MTGVIGLILLNFMSLFMIASIGIVGYSMAAEFNAIDKVGLIFALETCFRCAVCPISGKLGEKVGRKNLLIGALTAYTISFAVAAFATNITTIIVTRCICGAAWGCWMVNSFILFCDIFGQEAAPRYSGMAQTFGTVAILAAAPIAGVLCNVNWRLTYYICVPVLLVTLILCIIGVPKAEKDKNQAPMDIAGALCCALLLVPFCLAMAFGTAKGWTSPTLLVLYALSVVGLIGLIFAEKKAIDPILPVRLLKNKFYLSIFLTSFCFCVADAAGQYVPSYLQAVCGVSSTAASLVSLPGNILCAAITLFLGNYIAKHGRYRGMVVIWCVLSVISGVLMLFIGKGALAAIPAVFCMIATTPMSAGNAMQQVVPYTYPMVVLEPKDLAAGAAFMTFSGIFSSAVSNGVFTALMNSPAGMGSMFKLPIWLFAVMCVFGIFLFRDVKAGEKI